MIIIASILLLKNLRFGQANLASKNDVTDYIKKKTYFDDKIKNLNKKVRWSR